MDHPLKSTERFSSRVENYIRFRPIYPVEVIECLRANCGLTADSVIADVGSGTGILSQLFLTNGNQVIGVEPNVPMREAAEQLLATHARFVSRNGTAENTGLPDSSVDFVTAGQAFHWFDRAASHAEFARVLKPGGWVVLIWNERNARASAFDTAYERLLESFTVDYAAVSQRSMDPKAIEQFFTGGSGVSEFGNSQQFDFEGLKGRLLSSSYAPELGHELHERTMHELRAVFDTHQVNGTVTIHYDTNVYYGHL